jgi:hypothetical protein
MLSAVTRKEAQVLFNFDLWGRHSRFGLDSGFVNMLWMLMLEGAGVGVLL